MPTYQTIHTTVGLQKIAQAEATGTPINLVQMAVGDGNGNPITPSEGMTGLVRECYRANVNRVYQDPDNPLKFVAELVVPSDEGGFTIREVGIFDADGDLFAIANTPPAYKPTDTEGAYSDGIYRMEFLVGNASVVTLVVDPSVTVATQTWVTNNITAAALIPGGTTDQVLAKASNADGDVEWVDLSDVSVTVDMIEERQTLAAGQTIVNMATTTTRGLAVYIEGIRINRGAGADEWQPNGVSTTSIVLGQAYGAGSAILLTQNEPTGSVPAPLERSQNLADLQSVATARTNLDVFSKAEARQLAPAGEVAYFARSTAPSGWLKANGAAVSRTAYADLFAAIGTVFGAGDGFTTFNLPDLRGEFIRGWDDGRNIDLARALGSFQDHQNATHSHGATASAAGTHSHSASTGTGGAHSHTFAKTQSAGQAGNVGPNVGSDGSEGGVTSIDTITTSTHAGHNHSVSVDSAGSHTHDVTVASSGGNESRPRNIALLACIKF